MRHVTKPTTGASEKQQQQQPSLQTHEKATTGGFTTTTTITQPPNMKQIDRLDECRLLLTHLCQERDSSQIGGGSHT